MAYCVGLNGINISVTRSLSFLTHSFKNIWKRPRNKLLDNNKEVGGSVRLDSKLNGAEVMYHWQELSGQRSEMNEDTGGGEYREERKRWRQTRGEQKPLVIYALSCVAEHGHTDVIILHWNTHSLKKMILKKVRQQCLCLLLSGADAPCEKDEKIHEEKRWTTNCNIKFSYWMNLILFRINQKNNFMTCMFSHNHSGNIRISVV